MAQRLSTILATYPDVDIEAGIDLERIASLARELDRTGTVTVKFTAAKTGGRVLVSVGSTAKDPKPDAEAGLWHVGPDGLTKDDPYQGRVDPVTGAITTAPHAMEDTPE